MPLTEFGVDKPNPTAILEQALLITCVYKNQKQYAIDWLKTKGNYVIDVWIFRPEAWPPSMAVFHEVDTKKYYIVLAGTTNAIPQCARHLSGAEGTKIAENLYEHAFFHDAAIEAIKQFDDVVPEENVEKICLSSHSYGMAACCLASIRFAERLGEENVELLGFSEPRSVAKILTSFIGKSLDTDFRPHPHVHHIVVNYGDVVARLPPAGWDLFLRGVGAKMRRGDLSRVHWWARHWRAKEWLTTYTHELVQDTEDAEWALSIENWQKTIESRHYMRTYASKAVDIERKANGNLNIDLQKRMLAVNNLPELPKEPVISDVSPYIQDSDTANPWDKIFGFPLPQTPRNQTETVRLGVSGVQITKSGDVNGFRSNILLFGDLNMSVTNFKITQFINWGSPGARGHSESHVLKPSVTFADAQAKAIDLIYDRACLLGSSVETGGSLQINQSTPAVQYYRLSDPAKGEEAQTFDVDPLKGFGFKNRGDNQCDNPSTSLVIRLNSVNSNDASMKRRVSLILVGQSDPICKARKYDGTFKQDGTTGFSVFLKNYLDRLVGGDFGHMGQASGQAKKTVSKFEYDDTLSQWVLTVTGHTYATGEQVRLTRVNVSGFAGPYKIVVVDSNKIALAKGPSSDKPAPTAGQVQRIASANGNKLQDWYRYVSYSSLTPKISTKKVGRPFDGQTFFHKKRK